MLTRALVSIALISPPELAVVASALVGFGSKTGLIRQAFEFFTYLCNTLGLDRVFRELYLCYIGLEGRYN